MSQQIVLLGVDFRRAPIDVRERLSFSGPEAELLLTHLRGTGFDEALLIATCNRTEFYIVSGFGSSAVGRLIEELKQCRPDAKPAYQDCHRYTAEGGGAIQHLFRVAAGLESQILGDSHVLAQVREAVARARRARTLGGTLETAITCALRAAKRVRRQTSLSAASTSIGAAALRSIRRHRPRPEQAPILVVGAGQAARDIAFHLAKIRPHALRFAARRPEAGAAMAAEYGGEAVAWDRLADAVAEAGVVITAIGDRLAELSQHQLEARRGSSAPPLLIVDAGVPRNVDPSIGRLAGVTLVDVDSLEQERAAALSFRSQQVPLAEEILVEEFGRWALRSEWLAVKPALKELYLAAERVRTELMEEATSRRQHFGHFDVERVDGITRRLTKRLLAGPVERLRCAMRGPLEPPGAALTGWALDGLKFAAPALPGEVAAVLRFLRPEAPAAGGGEARRQERRGEAYVEGNGN